MAEEFCQWQFRSRCHPLPVPVGMDFDSLVENGKSSLCSADNLQPTLHAHIATCTNCATTERTSQRTSILTIIRDFSLAQRISSHSSYTYCLGALIHLVSISPVLAVGHTYKGVPEFLDFLRSSSKDSFRSSSRTHSVILPEIHKKSFRK